MAKRNSPTEEGDVPEGANAYRLLAYADDLVVPAPTRRDSAEASEGEDVLEIEYQPEEGLEEAPEDHSPEEARGHESNRGEVRSAEVQESVQGRTGRRRRRSKGSREIHVEVQRCTRAAMRPLNSHPLPSKLSTSPRRVSNTR